MSLKTTRGSGVLLADRLVAMLAELTLPELRILRKRFDNDAEQLARIDAAIAKKAERGDS